VDHGERIIANSLIESFFEPVERSFRGLREDHRQPGNYAVFGLGKCGRQSGSDAIKHLADRSHSVLSLCAERADYRQLGSKGETDHILCLAKIPSGISCPATSTGLNGLRTAGDNILARHTPTILQAFSLVSLPRRNRYFEPAIKRKICGPYLFTMLSPMPGNANNSASVCGQVATMLRSA
jgi:hypothetical protein